MNTNIEKLSVDEIAVLRGKISLYM